MGKVPVAMRLDSDLIERARAVAELDKKTLTQLVTDLLLAHIETREHYRAHMPHSRRFNRDKVRPRTSLSAKLKRLTWERCEGKCRECGVTKEGWRKQTPGFEGTPYGTLQVAHIIPQCNFENPDDAHTADNLTLLCPLCHQKHHSSERDTIDYENRIPARV